MAGVAIFMEETSRWRIVDSLIFFLVMSAILLPLSYWPWKHVRFEQREKRAQQDAPSNGG
jgi:lipopolysaccharide export system protein LptC